MVPSATKLTKKLIRPTTFWPQYDGVQRDYYIPRNKKETGNLVEYLLCTVQIGQTSGKSSVSSWYSSFPYELLNWGCPKPNRRGDLLRAGRWIKPTNCVALATRKNEQHTYIHMRHYIKHGSLHTEPPSDNSHKSLLLFLLFLSPPPSSFRSVDFTVPWPGGGRKNSAPTCDLTHFPPQTMQRKFMYTYVQRMWEKWMENTFLTFCSAHPLAGTSFKSTRLRDKRRVENFSLSSSPFILSRD